MCYGYVNKHKFRESYPTNGTFNFQSRNLAQPLTLPFFPVTLFVVGICSVNSEFGKFGNENFGQLLSRREPRRKWLTKKKATAENN